ncbi:hypothetical protein HK100_011209 [Physocladia obscura]|uniref:Uncharacterized protein n=1 Tax=Physocladia obscura TaxID=109957 RepID=A0AAD5T1Q2_9FUNG|nr:hypothetical protein HK100_011209 [Physocladia obscura]
MTNSNSVGMARTSSASSDRSATSRLRITTTTRSKNSSVDRRSVRTRSPDPWNIPSPILGSSAASSADRFLLALDPQFQSQSDLLALDEIDESEYDGSPLSVELTGRKNGVFQGPGRSYESSRHSLEDDNTHRFPITPQRSFSDGQSSQRSFRNVASRKSVTDQSDDEKGDFLENGGKLCGSPIRGRSNHSILLFRDVIPKSPALGSIQEFPNGELQVE